MLLPIKLSDKHQELILLMIKKLFPEYNLISINVSYKNTNQTKKIKVFKPVYFDSGYIGFPYKKANDINYRWIHWYEFSWVLLNKIFGKLYKSPIEMGKQIQIFGLICFNRSEIINHPVDFLYEKFQKL